MVVFAVRHADRTDADDLKIPEGIERAELLARMLAESGVRFAFRSDAVRAVRTLAPLEKALGNDLNVTEVAIEPPFGPAQARNHASRIVDAINTLPADAVAVVVSHSDTVPLIVEDLGGGIIGAIEGKEFDKLFVLFSGPTDTTLLRLRYGAATPAP
jgi:phosphohistidine phosphatase SixA